MGFRDQAVWNRDWSQHPNDWKMFALFTGLFALLAAAYLARGDTVGFGYLGLSVAMGSMTGYAYVKSRPGAG